MAFGALRQRLPLVGFVLLAILCLALFGFACACLNDHPMQALERALAAVPAVPAPVEIWSASLVAVLAGAVLAGVRGVLSDTPSPAALKRLLL